MTTRWPRNCPTDDGRTQSDVNGKRLRVAVTRRKISEPDRYPAARNGLVAGSSPAGPTNEINSFLCRLICRFLLSARNTYRNYLVLFALWFAGDPFHRAFHVIRVMVAVRTQ
jgi:hypothetical protein